MTDLKCIYCLRDKTADQFNAEHVISRAFGTFDNNLTLTGLVCRDCNQFFGDSLERVFARDSLEARYRIEKGLRPTAAIAHMPQQRLTFSAAIDGELDGLRLRLNPDPNGPSVILVPQVGLPTRTGRVYLTEPELTDRERPLPNGLDMRGRIHVIAPSDEAMAGLIELLAARGIPFERQGELALPPPSPDFPVEVAMRIDHVIKRCIAKYAFNYLAFVAGRDFVLLPSFNTTRSYIREGITPDYSLVVADDMPILFHDSRTRRQTDGHLITANWTTDRRHVVGQVSIFNILRYRVSLARNFSGLWRNIRSGHHFDLGSRQVSPMVATSLMIPRS